MCTPYADAAGMLHIHGKWESLNNLFCRNVSLLTAPHCQFQGVGQGMNIHICMCGIHFFKLNGIDAINEII